MTPEVTKDTNPPANKRNHRRLQPLVVQIQSRDPNPEPNVAPVVAPVPNTKPSVSLPYPSRRDNEKSRNQANEQIDKFYEIIKEMSFEISFTMPSWMDECVVELKELPPHLEYAFLEGDNKLPVIIAKELDVEEKSALIKVLKSHKRALAWTLSDIQARFNDDVAIFHDMVEKTMEVLPWTTSSVFWKFLVQNCSPV
ncbi:hypothetical protein Tco_0007877 [Tanacetum coccineum]